MSLCVVCGCHHRVAVRGTDLCKNHGGDAMKAEDLVVKVKVDMSDVEKSLAQMEARVSRFAGVSVSDQAIPLALLGTYAAGTQLRRPMSRRALLTGGSR